MPHRQPFISRAQHDDVAGIRVKLMELDGLAADGACHFATLGGTQFGIALGDWWRSEDRHQCSIDVIEESNECVAVGLAAREYACHTADSTRVDSLG